MSHQGRGVCLTLIAGLFTFGCQPEVKSGPSYADLVVTYNAELEALDRLEAKREKLIQEYAAAMPANAPVDALTQLEGLLESAEALKDASSEHATSDPESQLDGLIERRGAAKEIANQLLDGLLNGDEDAKTREPSPEEAAAVAERKAAFEKDLAELDAEIAKQKTRVERARKARDEAEAKSQTSEQDS